MSVDRIADRLMGVLSWAKVEASRAAAAAVGFVWTKGPPQDRYQHWQPYGFQSRPLPGADALVVAVGSNADQRIVWMVGDRRYTIELAAGEVVIVDDLGQKLHLTRTGIVIDANSIKLGASASLGVARETDPVALDTTPTTSWAAQVTTYINGVAPGTVTASPVGTITGGSAVTRSE